ncbi:hypothetical protein MMC24_003975 [Lignoscripta atroalba]|nr:hypothetical protein [Lignoscripta atroalba]
MAGSYDTFSEAGKRRRQPFAKTSRHKPRRWPLALRFAKGAIHGTIVVPVVLHALFAALIVYIDQCLNGHLGLPASIIPSLSIVVGLMLVFRNQTSYNRFWDGRNDLTVIITSVRNLTRMFLSCSYSTSSTNDAFTARCADRADTERTIRILVAILYAVKYHLRSDWGAVITPGTAMNSSPANATFDHQEYDDLLPAGLVGMDDKGLGLPLQLTFFVEQYIKRGHDKGWFHAPQASQMQVQLSKMVDAYGRMETIRLTPIPVAHLIHQKQVLSLFGMVLPFAMVDEMGWWAVPIVTLVIFTLYGIEGIGSSLEDPFGYDRNDIKMDAIAEDIRSEVMVLVEEWRRVGGGEEGDKDWQGKGVGGEMFMGGRGEGAKVPGVRVVRFEG